MPKNTQLPEALSELAFRHATQVRPGLDFKTDLDRLVWGLQKLMELEPGQTPTPKEPPESSEQSSEIRHCPHCHKGLRIPTSKLRKGGHSNFACPRCRMSLRLIHDGIRIEAIAKKERPEIPAEEDRWGRIHKDVFGSDPQKTKTDWDQLAEDLGCGEGPESQSAPEQPAEERASPKRIFLAPDVSDAAEAPGDA